jgi:hypothetical protein
MPGIARQEKDKAGGDVATGSSRVPVNDIQHEQN